MQKSFSWNWMNVELNDKFRFQFLFCSSVCVVLFSIHISQCKCNPFFLWNAQNYLKILPMNQWIMMWWSMVGWPNNYNINTYSIDMNLCSKHILCEKLCELTSTHAHTMNAWIRIRTRGNWIETQRITFNVMEKRKVNSGTWKMKHI